MSTPPKACVIGHITVKDPSKWAEYCSRVPATVAPWSAEVVFRGQRVKVLDGDHHRRDTVVLKFPSIDAVDGWYQSAAYQVLIPLRRQAADIDLITFEE